MLSAYDHVADNTYRERLGLDFEDFAPGQRFRHRPGVTLSQQDNAGEALETLNAAMLHYDAHYAAATTWRRPLMVSTLVVQRIIGMASKTYGNRTAITGFPEIALTAPVFGGDTLYADSEILSCEPGTDIGLVTARLHAIKSDGTEIGRLTARFAIRHRNESASPRAAAPRFAAYAETNGTLLEQTGLFFEDLHQGDTFHHTPRRQVSAAAIEAHATRALELGHLHEPTNPPTATETFLIAQATAATTRSFGRVVANLGWHDIELPHPVQAGDMIDVRSHILETRLSRSRPNEGIVSVSTEARNQHNTQVLTYRRTLLVYRRAAETPYAAAGY